VTGFYLWNPWRSAESHPGRPAILIDGRKVTFRELTKLADDFRRGLAAVGVPDGAVVGTSLPIGPELFSLALAALRGGYGLFPVSRDTDLRRRADQLAAADASVDVVADPIEAAAGIRGITVDELRTAGTRSDRHAEKPPGEIRAGYLVFTSSGTTGEPKVVVRQRPWYSYKGVAVMPRYGAGPDRGPHVMANPTYHLGTLGPALYALQAGSGVAVMRAWSAEQFFSVVSRERAETAFVSPNQLTDLVVSGMTPCHPMSCLFHGGAGIPPDIKRQAIRLFGPILHEYYGTSTGIITEVTTAQWLERPGTVGRPLPGVRLQTVRDGRELRAGEVGAIRVRYRSIDRDRGGEFEDTGDIGYLDEDGFLFVLGRGSADGAERAALLEHLIRSLSKVCDAAVTSVPGGATCVVEFLPDSGPGLEDQVRQLGHMLGTGFLSVTLGPAGTFPRTASGKLTRRGMAHDE
jgi:long-chain acyl-CoA synthetase